MLSAIIQLNVNHSKLWTHCVGEKKGCSNYACTGYLVCGLSMCTHFSFLFVCLKPSLGCILPQKQGWNVGSSGKISHSELSIRWTECHRRGITSLPILFTYRFYLHMKTHTRTQTCTHSTELSPNEHIPIFVRIQTGTFLMVTDR